MLTSYIYLSYMTGGSSKAGGSGGMFSLFKGLVGAKALTKADLEPVISKLRDNLINKV